MSEKMKPCWRCGGEMDTNTTVNQGVGGDDFYLSCMQVGCGAEGPVRKSLEEAIAAANTRPAAEPTEWTQAVRMVLAATEHPQPLWPLGKLRKACQLIEQLTADLKAAQEQVEWYKTKTASDVNAAAELLVSPLKSKLKTAQEREVKTRLTVALLNSMILSGESHSKRSRQAVEQALKDKNPNQGQGD